MFTKISFIHWDLNNLDLKEKKSSPFSFSTHQRIGFNVTKGCIGRTEFIVHRHVEIVGFVINMDNDTLMNSQSHILDGIE